MPHHMSIQYDGVVHARTGGNGQYVRCGHLTRKLDIEEPTLPTDMPDGAFAVDLDNIEYGVSVCIECYPRARESTDH